MIKCLKLIKLIHSQSCFLTCGLWRCPGGNACQWWGRGSTVGSLSSRRLHHAGQGLHNFVWSNRRRVERGDDVGNRQEQTRITLFKKSTGMRYLFLVLLQSLLLFNNISKRHMKAGHIPVVHEWHLTMGLWLVVQWLCPVSWSRSWTYTLKRLGNKMLFLKNAVSSSISLFDSDNMGKHCYTGKMHQM